MKELRLKHFVETCGKVASTRGKLTKVEAVASYLGALSEEELPVEARFPAGAPLPAPGELTLGIGYASVRNVACRLAGCSHALFAGALLRHGDLDEACQEMLEGHLPHASGLSLTRVQACFQAIALARGAGKKEALLAELLAHVSPGEAKYIEKIVTSDLRIGLVGGLVEEGIARMARAPLEDIRRARMLLGDLGQTALIARQGRLAEAAVVLLHPLGFMLASPAAGTVEALKLFSGPVLVEDKYDDIRAQVHKDGQRVKKSAEGAP